MTDSAQHRGWIPDVASAAMALVSHVRIRDECSSLGAGTDLHRPLRLQGWNGRAYPFADLIMDAAGNRYGTSSTGE